MKLAEPMEHGLGAEPLRQRGNRRVIMMKLLICVSCGRSQLEFLLLVDWKIRAILIGLTTAATQRSGLATLENSGSCLIIPFLNLSSALLALFFSLDSPAPARASYRPILPNNPRRNASETKIIRSSLERLQSVLQPVAVMVFQIFQHAIVFTNGHYEHHSEGCPYD